MKKLLLSCMMLLGIGEVTYAEQVSIYAPKEDGIFTSIDAIGTTPFAIVNTTDGKAVFNSDAQNLKYDSYAIAFASRQQSFYYVLESLADNADESVRGCYLLRAVKSDGTNVSFWGNSAVYLNSGDTFNGCFVLGNGDKLGTDIKYGGVWEVQYDTEHQGWTLKNKAKGGYFRGPGERPDEGKDPIYWTFCTLQETQIENPITVGSYDATDANETAFAGFKTIANDATWTPETKVFTKECGWQWEGEGLNLSQYRYLVITAAQNRDGEGFDGGPVSIKDKNGLVVKGDDYGDGNFNLHMSKWNHHNCCLIDLEKLRHEQMFDIYHITQLTIDGGSNFVLGNVYATNTKPATYNPWGQDNEGSFRITGLEENQYGTVCLPYQAAVAGAYIYEITGKTSDGITLSAPVSGLLEAGKPYIYKTIPNRSNTNRFVSGNSVYFYQATAATVTNAGNSNGLVGTFSILPDLELTPSGTKLVTKRILANQAYVDLNAVTGTGSETTLATSDETESWTSLNDDNSYVFKQHGIGGPWVATLTDGVCSVESFAKVSAEWDTQFWIRANKKLPKDTKFFVSFQYKADNAATVSTQQHKKPSEYLGGNLGNLNFTTEWQTFAGEFTSVGDNMSSIALNLNQEATANKYYFKNAKFEVLSDVAASLTDADPVDAIPTPTITVGDALYSTYSANYSVKFDNVEAYTAKYDATNNCVKLTQVTEIPANTAVVIKAAAADTYTESLTRVLTAVENNDLKVSQWGDNQATGDGTIYVLAKKGDVVGFYKLADGEKVTVGKGYLTIATAAGREFIGFADDATTIKAVESLKESGLIYNLAGQQVKNAQKGVFIIDGKKVIK